MSISKRHRRPALSKIARELALEGFEGAGRPHYEIREKYEWLKDMGSQLWLDTGEAGAADKVWGPEIDALTTNNTLVNQVVQTGAMDGLIGYAAEKSRNRSRISPPKTS